MPKNTQKQYRYTQNRELSWLRFDRRVLEEAADSSVPALERLKFVSIFSSNLDELFMVRVGSLFDLAHMTPDDTDSKTGWTPVEQLHNVYRAIPGLLTMKKQIYAAVMEELRRCGIEDVFPDALDAGDLKQMNRFFKTELLPVLSPIAIGPNHPVPHLVNKKLCAAALLENKKGHKAVGIIPVPDSAPPYLLLADGKRFVRTESILLRWLPTLFDAYTVKESCILTVTRNADISFDDDKFEDDGNLPLCNLSMSKSQRYSKYKTARRKCYTMTFVETPRLLLRKVTQADYPYFRTYLTDKHMDEMMLRSPCNSEEDIQAGFDWFLNKEDRAYVIVHKEAGTVIGNLTVYDKVSTEVTQQEAVAGKNGKALSFAMSPAWQRRGLMLETVRAVIDRLFSEENADYINCGYLSYNVPSKMLQEKLGFDNLRNKVLPVQSCKARRL